MKLFHLSDLHIGKRVNEFSMLEDQKYILRQILKAAKDILKEKGYDGRVSIEAYGKEPEKELEKAVFIRKYL